NEGADLRADAPQGPMVAQADYHRDTARYLGAVRDRSGIHRALVLRTAVPLPDAVLLAMCQRRMRAGIVLPGHVDPRGATDHPVRVRHAAVHPRLPAELLLLPRRLLPGVLAGADGVRGARAARTVYRREQVPADRAEPAPVLVLLRVAGLGAEHLG